MKCTVCGADSTTLEQRYDAATLTTHRVRTCWRGHKFPTVEVPPAFLAGTRERGAAARAVGRRLSRWERDSAICADPRTAVEVAHAYKLTLARIKQIRASHARLYPHHVAPKISPTAPAATQKGNTP
jgi:hypothetical protein